MTELRVVLAQTAELIADFRDAAAERPVVPNVDLDFVRMALGELVSSPAAAVVEEVAGAWLQDLLGIPSTASFG